VKLSEAAATVIDLSITVQAYWDVELPKRHPDYPFVHPGEDSGPPPPAEVQLRAFLAGLPLETVHKLLLIMNLGRGYFGTSDLASHYDQIRTWYAKPVLAIALLIGTASLADYLADGLAQLDRDRIDPDELPVELVRSRR